MSETAAIQSDASVEVMFERVRNRLAQTGWNLGSVDESKLILQCAVSETFYLNSVKPLQSRAEILKGWRYFEYWFFEGAPLSVQIACYVGLQTGTLSPPERLRERATEFLAYFENQIAFKTAVNQSETVGGWLFPGEPEMLWETVQRVTNTPGDLCEIGSWLGRSTILLASAVSLFSGHKKLHVIDDWNFGGQPSLYPYLTDNRHLKEEFDENLSPWSAKLVVHQATFEVVQPTLKRSNPEGISLVFHDAGHLPADFERDLPLIDEILNDSGILIIHDYSWKDFTQSRAVIDLWLEQSDRFSLKKIVGYSAVIEPK
jgi:hypothetical protein